MKMKLIITFFTCLLLFSVAQVAGQVHWHVQAAINSSNIRVSDPLNRQESPDARIGFNIGLGADIPLWGDFSVQPTFQYAKRGFVVGQTYSVGWGANFKASTSYLELPVDFVYSPAFGHGNLLLGVGPYVGYGTGGRWRTDNPVLMDDIVIDNQGELVFQNDASYGNLGTYVLARPWDYGLHGKVGYRLFGRYLIQLEHQQGLKNLNPHWSGFDNGNSLKNSSWALSVGYQL